MNECVTTLRYHKISAQKSSRCTIEWFITTSRLSQWLRRRIFY